MARQEFSKNVKLAALKRAMDNDGIIWCERCGGRIAGGNGPEFHHNIEAAISGPNTLENCIVLCRRPCHDTITRTHSIPQVAKTKRIANKRANVKPKGRPLPGNRNSPFKQKLDGSWERRT